MGKRGRLVQMILGLLQETPTVSKGRGSYRAPFYLTPRPRVALSLFVMSCRPGSTSEPKGVMITHTNLADNLKLIVTGLCAVDDTVVVGWLPQVHNT